MRPIIYDQGEAAAPGNEFFSTLIPFDKFTDAFNTDLYRPVPDDWLIVVCKVEAATQAIRHGRYKDVNVTGASAIIAVLNATAGTEIPYVFAGDGAVFVIPASLRTEVAAALNGARSLARASFRLVLRVGIVPVTHVREAGHDLLVGRYRMSEKVATAMFEGSGIAHAESLVRNSEIYCLPADHGGEADFSGLECRWRPVTPTQGHMMAIIIRSTENHKKTAYRDFYDRLTDICRPNDALRPTQARSMRLSPRPRDMRHEHAVQTHGKNFREKIRYAGRLGLYFVIGRLLFDFRRDFRGLNGEAHMTDILRHTDFQRFDNTLRMVIDVTSEQAERLTTYLTQQQKAGHLCFGVDIGPAALITCLVFNRADNHIHFVDGASGGYALAARALEEQMRARVLTQFYHDRGVV